MLIPISIHAEESNNFYNLKIIQMNNSKITTSKKSNQEFGLLMAYLNWLMLMKKKWAKEKYLNFDELTALYINIFVNCIQTTYYLIWKMLKRLTFNYVITTYVISLNLNIMF